MNKATSVHYFATGYGYTVQALDDECQPVEEYTAGNSAGCSQTFLPLGHRFALPESTMEKYAYQTAVETAEKHGLTAANVHYDVDAATAFLESVEAARE